MEAKRKTPTRPTRLTGRLKDGHTIADVMDKEDIYDHVFYALAATFDRLAERLAESEIQEEQTEIAGTLARLGTAIMLHKIDDALAAISRTMPDGSYIAEAIQGLEL